ncbi:MAG: TldD/PmbA family protein [bacterium]
MKNNLQRNIEGAINWAKVQGAEFADARWGAGKGIAIEVQDGRLEKVHATSSEGVGIRVLMGGSWGFASANGADKRQVERCVRDALAMAKASIGRQTEHGIVAETQPFTGTAKTEPLIHPDDVPMEAKINKAVYFEEKARKYDERVTNTQLTYRDGSGESLVMNTFGTCVRTATVRTFAAVRVVAADGGQRQRAFEIVGRRGGFEVIEELDASHFSEAASSRAIRLLAAEPPPSGSFPVIFDPSIAGLLVHEAFGHNAEADHVWSGESIIAGKFGEQVASPLVTIVDDPTLAGAWGSYDYDSEGTPAQRRVLIENGVVVGFLNSLETAAQLGMQPNGAARCENHHYRPIVRMSNTFFAPGAATLDEMIKKIDTGIMVGKALGGYVATEKGQFTCRAGESWLIRNGQKEKLLRDVAVSGLTLEALRKVEAVSSDFSLSMPGTCGKLGQGVPVDDGGPYILISELVVGGQS